MVAVNLYDSLTFTDDPSGEISLRCNEPTLPVGGDNLVVMAAERLKASARSPSRGADRAGQGDPGTGGAGRRLERRGGDARGSGPALGPSTCRRTDCERWPAEIGSDVTFFTHAPAAVCRGRGERVEPVALREQLSLCAGLSAGRNEHGRRLPSAWFHPNGRDRSGRFWRPSVTVDWPNWVEACSIGFNQSPRPCGPNWFGSETPWRAWARCSTGP